MSLADAQTALISRLLALRWLPRTDAAVQRALLDEEFRADVDRRLALCGLRLLDNPFAQHVALAFMPAQEQTVLRPDDAWLSNTGELPRDAVALLVMLWALLILPKRERQTAGTDADGQASLLASAALAALPPRTMTKQSLVDDYANRLGGRVRMQKHLSQLKNLGFIELRDDLVTEGPLLDLAFDYASLAPRLLDGVVADLAKRRATVTAKTPT